MRDGAFDEGCNALSRPVAACDVAVERSDPQEQNRGKDRSALDAITRAEAFVCRSCELAGKPSRADHALQVGELLADLGCSSDVVTAGVLHDIVEDTRVTVDDVNETFGERVGALVGKLTEDRSILDYRERKRALLLSVQGSGRSGMLIFTADKLARLRTADIDGADIAPRQLEHYQRSLELLIASGIRSRHVEELQWRLRMRRGPASRRADAPLLGS